MVFPIKLESFGSAQTPTGFPVFSSSHFLSKDACVNLPLPSIPSNAIWRGFLCMKLFYLNPHRAGSPLHNFHRTLYIFCVQSLHLLSSNFLNLGLFNFSNFFFKRIA